ncbi:transglycosylase domain-containing protein [Ktedonobacter sp. SOSP1-85]|uniref:transglycosylase domain-containing protein n=1 Tax=Ktedonobacter sp. SOSP1-85 TaxID=2778367 RepID=UPI0019157B77|nr:transglycosylase domain-containing protein [Ktedonobacter sp. SOSP1-85]
MPTNHSQTNSSSDSSPSRSSPQERPAWQQENEHAEAYGEQSTLPRPPLARQPTYQQSLGQTGIPHPNASTAPAPIVKPPVPLNRTSQFVQPGSIRGGIQPAVPPPVAAYAGSGSRPLSQPLPGTSQRQRHARVLRKKRVRLKQPRPDMVARLLMGGSLLFLVALLFTFGGTGIAYGYYQMQLSSINGIAQHSLFQNTHIYDRHGKLLYELYDKQLGKGRRTYVSYQDISPLLINATVAAEDHTFWSNGGVDLQGIGRALLSNARSGGVREGGSTITQQLIKNQFFSGKERTVGIKFQEAVLAAGITQQYPKWKIMEMYLNTVYYGNINYGVEAAARDYFGLKPDCQGNHCKPAVSRLTLGQASLLAGLPQSPTYYNPVINKDVALERQQVVLNAMVAMKMITPQQARQARQETQQSDIQSYSTDQEMKAPHFVQYVINQLEEVLGGPEQLRDGGFDVYTTLDYDLEQKVEEITYNNLYTTTYDRGLGTYNVLSRDKNVNNASVVVMDPKTGEILAMNGSASYEANYPQVRGQLNGTTTPRQPGSSFKPIVYATAFEMGWYPAMIVSDHRTIYPVDPPDYYHPQNYDGSFHSDYPMTVRTALANSFNIPAIDAIMFTGVHNVQNMSARLGISEVANLPDAQTGPSMALGSKEVSLLHMTDAYATFANQGLRMPPVSILSVKSNQGRELYSFHPRGIRALRPDVAFLMNDILSDRVARYKEFYPGNPLELSRPAAAKTGTTDSFRDNWTIGYTPYLTVGVWAGNSNNEQMYDVIGITGAGPIWHDVMEYASQHYNFPPDDFPRPDNVHRGAVSANTGLAYAAGEGAVSDWFIDGTQPTIQGANYYVPPLVCPKPKDDEEGDSASNADIPEACLKDSSKDGKDGDTGKNSSGSPNAGGGNSPNGSQATPSTSTGGNSPTNNPQIIDVTPGP